ncbi:MAG: hypothetical protein KGP28_02395 [Bdellovibrionales bacterium]|nr:hypothetical protein [Bdellovibrionales bacterium]
MFRFISYGSLVLIILFAIYRNHELSKKIEQLERHTDTLTAPIANSGELNTSRNHSGKGTNKTIQKRIDSIRTRLEKEKLDLKNLQTKQVQLLESVRSLDSMDPINLRRKIDEMKEQVRRLREEKREINSQRAEWRSDPAYQAILVRLKSIETAIREAKSKRRQENPGVSWQATQPGEALSELKRELKAVQSEQNAFIDAHKEQGDSSSVSGVRSRIKRDIKEIKGLEELLRTRENEDPTRLRKELESTNELITEKSNQINELETGLGKIEAER